VVDLGPVRACSCEALIRNAAGSVVAYFADGQCREHGPSAITFTNLDKARLIADQRRLTQDAIRAYSSVPVIIGPQEAVLGPLHAYWSEGPGADRLRAAPGWSAPSEARSDDLGPVVAEQESPARHWGEYDEWLKPADRLWLDDQWARSGGGVDLSWVTTEPEYRTRALWLMGWPLVLGVAVIAVAWVLQLM